MHFIDCFVGDPDRVECNERLEIFFVRVYFVCLQIICQISLVLNICHGFIHVKAFFFAAKTTEKVVVRNRRKSRDVTVLCSSKFLRFIVVIPFQLVWKFTRLVCAKKKKLALWFLSFNLQWCTTIFRWYHILFITDFEWPWLPMPWEWKKMQSSFCFQPFLFYYFMFDKLENNFLLYMIISIYNIYIFTQIYIYIM